jgi:hypothetical protein
LKWTAYRIEDDLDRALAADLPHLWRRVAHPLKALEHIALGAAILVDGHAR